MTKIHSPWIWTKHNNNKTIRSFWSTEPRPPRTARAVNHSVLSPLSKASTYVQLTCLKLCLFNIRSLTNKAQLVSDFIMDKKLDLLCLTETWQQSDFSQLLQSDFSQLNAAVPPGYAFISNRCTVKTLKSLLSLSPITPLLNA